MSMAATEQYDVLVIGSGEAGMANVAAKVSPRPQNGG
jgi:succinate dehydrogenase/fumarate reductase flavoprotein subunit